jgi:hypothetical protein
MKIIFKKYFEVSFWVTALILLAWMPFGEDSFSLCPFHSIGLPFCPGCGLGRSVHLIFEGDFIGSFRKHPLGFAALIIILNRIFTLIKINLKNKQLYASGYK